MPPNRTFTPHMDDRPARHGRHLPAIMNDSASLRRYP